jgi:putative ABC transport system ATP-binding protein
MANAALGDQAKPDDRVRWDPTLLLCDEPTGDLDRETAGEILDLLATLNARYDKTVIMVTHDPRAAERAGRVLHMDKGTLVEAAA